MSMATGSGERMDPVLTSLLGRGLRLAAQRHRARAARPGWLV